MSVASANKSRVLLYTHRAHIDPQLPAALGLGAVCVKHSAGWMQKGLSVCAQRFPGSDVILLGEESPGMETFAALQIAMDANPGSMVLGTRVSQTKPTFASSAVRWLTKLLSSAALGKSVADIAPVCWGIPAYVVPAFAAMRAHGYRFIHQCLLCLRRRKIDLVPLPFAVSNLPNSYARNGFRQAFWMLVMLLQFVSSSLISMSLELLVSGLTYPWLQSMGLSAMATLLWSNIAGRAVSSILNFSINRIIVFKDKTTSTGLWSSLGKYYILVACMITMSILLQNLMRHLGDHWFLYKMIVDLVLFFVNFWFQRDVVFRHKKQSKQ